MNGAVGALFGDASEAQAGALRIVDYLSAVGLPLLVLLAVALVLPGALAKRLPETLPGLGINLAVCWAVLAALTAILLQLAAWAHGGSPTWRLIPIAALFWGPVPLVIVMTYPQRWRPDL